MRKYASLCALLLACILFVSCGDDNAKMTGKGIFGALPTYLSQYYELKKQCLDELEFEDNKEKRTEILNKYQEQWEKSAKDLAKEVSKDDLYKEVPIIAPEELGITNVHIVVSGLDLNINKKNLETSLSIEMRYEQKGPQTKCFFLDENDSIIYADRFDFQWNHNGRTGMGFSDLYIADDKDYSQMILDLYALDKTKKIKICSTEEEAQACLQSSERHTDAMIKSLHDAGLLKYNSLEEFKNAKTQKKDALNKDDKTKPGAVDLAYFQLRGPVKFVDQRGRYDVINQYTFSERGKWETINGIKIGTALTDIKRDAEKRIIEYTEGEFDDISSYKVTYDAKTGQVAKYVCDSEGTITTTFTYDESGNVSQLVEDGYYQEMGAETETKVHETITYKYVKIDDHGNWLNRTAKSSDGSSWVERRRIMYYNNR